MKKNIMMRMAAVLLVGVLLTTSVIGGTFAKYTTSATGSDTARVAKWGVTIVANGEIFTTNYDDTAISASATEDIVAPGTKGDLVAMVIAGTPEVDVNVKYEATLKLDGWKLEDNTAYCPIKFTVGTTVIDGSQFSSLDQLISEVEAAIENYSDKYEANVNLGQNVNAPVVSWEWPFEVDDVKDTYLGDKAAAGEASQITLSITTTITQID